MTESLLLTRLTNILITNRFKNVDSSQKSNGSNFSIQCIQFYLYLFLTNLLFLCAPLFLAVIMYIWLIKTLTRRTNEAVPPLPPPLSLSRVNLDPHPRLSASSSSRRSEVKARQDVKPDFRHPPFTDYRQPPVDYRHPPVTDYRQPPTLDYRQPPGLLDFRQHPAAAQFPLGIPTDFRPQVGTPAAKSRLLYFSPPPPLGQSLQ